MGIQAVVEPERSDKNLREFYNDIIRVGLGQCDPKLVAILVEESGAVIEDLISYGLLFKKDQHDNYLRVKGCFSESERAFLTDNFKNVRQTFTSILKQSSAKILTGYALELLVKDNTCWGAWIVAATGESIRINAKATIIATGGGAGVYENHLVSDNDVGDGYALAYRAGAELTNMEFLQFMLGLKENGSRRFLPISSIQKPGVMVDISGRDLMERHFIEDKMKINAIKIRERHGPFSCRDLSCEIDFAVAQAKREGESVFWSEDGSKYAETEVVHFAHAFNGGVKINEEAKTTIEGLYAAGEVAAGPHGADRIGGCMMTATQVFGRRAGFFAGQRAKRLQGQEYVSIPNEEEAVSRCQSEMKGIPTQSLSVVAGSAKKTMGRFAGVLRRRDGLNKCNEVLKNCDEQLKRQRINSQLQVQQYFRVRNMILTSNIIVNSALKRKESRGGHYRDDYPFTTYQSGF